MWILIAIVILMMLALLFSMISRSNYTTRHIKQIHINRAYKNPYSLVYETFRSVFLLSYVFYFMYRIVNNAEQNNNGLSRSTNMWNNNVPYY